MIKTNKKSGDIELTGYPSVDKPWKSFYENRPKKCIETKRKIYDCLFDLNKDHMDMPAIGYFGVELTYSDLKTKADRALKRNYYDGMNLAEAKEILNSANKRKPEKEIDSSEDDLQLLVM